MTSPTDRCADGPCGHTRAEHGSLAGCIVSSGGRYCACRRFQEAPGAEAPTARPPITGYTTGSAVPMPTPGGATYDEAIDGHRLSRQQSAVYALVKDGRFRTLAEISQATGFPESSVSARLRDFRKPPLNRDVQRRRRNGGGTWEYAVLAPEA